MFVFWQGLPQGFGSTIGNLPQSWHNVCHKVLVQLLVTFYKVATMFVTRFCFNCWLFAIRFPQGLSQGFDSIIGYLPQGCHKLCHTVLVQLLDTCHKASTMFVTRCLFNYWLFATRLVQCLSQGCLFDYWLFATRLAQCCHKVCHKVLVELLITCHNVTTTFVTRFWFKYWLFATRLQQSLSQGFCSIIGYLS